MNRTTVRGAGAPAVLAGVLLALGSAGAEAAIDGITGTTFNLTAKVDNVSTADGGSVLLWGYADDDGSNNGRAQYPGPTLIVNQGDTVTVNLKNGLTVAGGAVPNVSMVFPGQDVTASCSTPGTDTCPEGVLTKEAETDGDVVSYTFTATHAGTYMYHSGTNPGLQVEMGLTGALIVRPANFDANAPRAYGHADAAYDYEHLFFLSEMDPRIHKEVALNGVEGNAQLQEYLDNYFSNYWFINGRTAPDNFSEAFVPWLPTQPYNSVPRMHPGDKLLMRVVGAGRDRHPFHHHGEHARIIAVDGRLLESAPGMGSDLAAQVFTTTSVPGKTSDAIFEWTGKGLNWDIYGGSDVWPEMAHDCVDGDGDDFDDTTHEYCPDHGKPFPVVLPDNADLAFGAWWSGSPYLGSLAALPPGEGGLNPNGGFSYMWHSHTEKELTNYDIFPGGMLTMLIIEAYNVPIE